MVEAKADLLDGPAEVDFKWKILVLFEPKAKAFRRVLAPRVEVAGRVDGRVGVDSAEDGL